MKRDHLHLIPRSSPAFPLPSPHEPLELNSLGYAGLMLVRSEEEEQSLLECTEGKGGLLDVLRHCGVPREWGEKAVEAGAALHAGDEYLL
jgi:ATP adenylyltransferase